MKTQRHLPLTYETPQDLDILEAYVNKGSTYRRSDALKIMRALRQLAS
jgi:hypothetical protein